MNLRSFRKAALAVAAAAAASTALVLAGCMTVNHLDRYDFEGSRLAVDFRTPPEPQLRINYDITLDSHNAVLSALSVMTNLAKANQAAQVRENMRAALAEVDVPQIVRSQTFSACASSLGAAQVDSRRDSDYVLVIRIDEWGIEARNAFTPVSLRMKLLATLYPASAGRSSSTEDLAWRREVTVDQPADPDMFGGSSLIGNMVTATVLSNMTEEDLVRGFRELGSLTARRVAMILERDLDEARFGGN
ncbi:MAG TPA: hypothetical protein VMF68_02205 [Spirochaetia bacterium]|nr:hypothetical protein [Spirochaetia bacterium]